MKRREFVERLGVGSAGIVAGTMLGSSASAATGRQHDHDQVTGPLASATVSFGQWLTPLDRFGTNPPPTVNQHLLIPYTATIKAGGSVNFVISGLHLVAIYQPGTTVEELQAVIGSDPALGLVIEPGLPFGGFLNQPAGRIYRGLDPRPLTRDRVEVVTLADPGTYLVVCGVIAHLGDAMHGWIKVVS
jgi:plastocyanin